MGRRSNRHNNEEVKLLNAAFYNIYIYICIYCKMHILYIYICVYTYICVQTQIN